MSQSDYIRHKRVANELKNQADNLAPVIGAGQYIDYKAFTLENTILSSKPNYTKLVPPSSVNIFGIQMDTPSNCPTFILCSQTNSRVNRKLSSLSYPKPLAKPKRKFVPGDMCICNYY